MGQIGTQAGELWLPDGMRIDEEDRIYVVDQENRGVRVFEDMGQLYLAKGKEAKKDKP